MHQQTVFIGVADVCNTYISTTDAKGPGKETDLLLPISLHCIVFPIILTVTVARIRALGYFRRGICIANQRLALLIVCAVSGALPPSCCLSTHPALCTRLLSAMQYANHQCRCRARRKP